MRVWFFIPLLWLVGCSPAPQESVPAPKPPPAVRSVAGQDAAVQRGKAMVAETVAPPSANLQSAIPPGSVSNALPFCSLAASPLTAKRVVLQAGAAVLISTNPPAAFATDLPLGQIAFVGPILINHKPRLKCHGESGRDIGTGDLAILWQHYPEAKATGFAFGQLRGVWRIDIPLANLLSGPRPPGGGGADS